MSDDTGNMFLLTEEQIKEHELIISVPCKVDEPKTGEMFAKVEWTKVGTYPAESLLKAQLRKVVEVMESNKVEIHPNKDRNYIAIGVSFLNQLKREAE